MNLPVFSAKVHSGHNQNQNHRKDYPYRTFTVRLLQLEKKKVWWLILHTVCRIFFIILSLRIWCEIKWYPMLDKFFTSRHPSA